MISVHMRCYSNLISQKKGGFHPKRSSAFDTRRLCYSANPVLLALLRFPAVKLSAIPLWVEYEKRRLIAYGKTTNREEECFGFYKSGEIDTLMG